MVWHQQQAFIAYLNLAKNDKEKPVITYYICKVVKKATDSCVLLINFSNIALLK
jgi:hypothetical protein